MKFKVLVFLLLSIMASCQAQNQRALRLRRSEMTEKEKRLPRDQCGKQKPDISPIISGGRPARLGELPWMAAIGYRTLGYRTDITWRCGGSLITDKYVITAAHCINKKLLIDRIRNFHIQYVPVKVRLGDLNLDAAVNDGASPHDYEIESFVAHKDFSNTHKIYDLGLIKLTEKVIFSDLVRPICLPPTNLQTPMFREEEFPYVAGWGITENQARSDQLLTVRVKIANQESCRENHTAENPKHRIDDSVLCAGTKGMDSCKGDSGGPLMYYYEPGDSENFGRLFLIGVVSYGVDCGRDWYPGVYSRVSYHMPWILEHLDI